MLQVIRRMKIFLKVFLSGILLSFVFAVAGGIAGAFLSGVITFPEIGYARGYESGAMIIGTLGTVIGGTFGSWLALSRSHKTNTFLLPTVIVVVIAMIMVCGYAVLEKEFDDTPPSLLLDGINVIIWAAMSLIIARRAMRAPIAS